MLKLEAFINIRELSVLLLLLPTLIFIRVVLPPTSKCARRVLEKVILVILLLPGRRLFVPLKQGGDEIHTLGHFFCNLWAEFLTGPLRGVITECVPTPVWFLYASVLLAAVYVPYKNERTWVDVLRLLICYVLLPLFLLALHLVFPVEVQDLLLEPWRFCWMLLVQLFEYVTEEEHPAPFRLGILVGAFRLLFFLIFRR